MAFTLDGTIVRVQGVAGTIRQEQLAWDTGGGGRDVMIADLRIELHGQPDMRGKLRFTSDAYERLPGKDDAEKASAVARRLIGWVSENGLLDGFFLRIDANDDGVRIVDASR